MNTLLPDRRIATLGAFGAAALAVLCLTSCSGGDPAGEIVARVEGVGPIGKTTLEHWIHVEAVVLYQEHPTGPVPKGVIPDPPDYAACIAYLKAIYQKLPQGAPEPTFARFKSRCKQRLQELKVLTLNTLIGWDWTMGAGLALGMQANAAEVKHRFATVNKNLFPEDGAEFTKYLKLTGQTLPDIMFRYKVQVFEEKLLEKLRAMEKHLPRGLTAEQAATRRPQSTFAKFVRYLPPGKRWAAITDCREGYVVSACKQYKGPEPPGIPN